jgi:catechol 2,3-dioxygenase-like lactoylglutathione lyase family enzyme
MAYVELDVADVDAATQFWTNAGGLEVNEVVDGVVYLRGGRSHHWIALHPTEGTPGLRTLGYEVERDEDLDEFEQRLASAGVTTERVVDRAWQGETLSFVDPSGHRVELVASWGYVPVPPVRGWFAPTELLHAVVVVDDLEASYEFFTGVLGFRESDRVIGRTIFLRSGNAWHHSLVIVGSRGNPHLDHICFLMDDIDDLMRARASLLQQGVEMGKDLLRHPTSGSMSFYATAVPAPTTLEMCIEHAKVDDSNHRPRALVPSPWANNVWLPPTT